VSRRTGIAAGVLAWLQDALRAEFTAVYGYGLVGARLSGTEEATATAAFEAHENRRDVIRRLILDAGGEPAIALPAYRPRHPVVSRVSALWLAVGIEDSCAAAYVRVLAVTDDGQLRRSTAGWLSDSAVRDMLWRSLLGSAALTAAPPLPGLVAVAPPSPNVSASGGPATRQP
jgi:hypothetical protein